jgi:hypothetical protein
LKKVPKNKYLVEDDFEEEIEEIKEEDLLERSISKLKLNSYMITNQSKYNK